MSKVCQIISELIILVGMVALVVTGFSTVATADTEVNAATVVVVSDDIMNRTTSVARPDGAGPAAAGGGDDAGAGGGDDAGAGGDDEAGGGNDNNRSGLGDGTNPGLGDGTSNSPNEGTDNPNNAPANRGGGKK